MVTWRSVVSRNGAADAFERRSRETLLQTAVAMAALGVVSGLPLLSESLQLGVCGGLVFGSLGVVTLLWGVSMRRYTHTFMVLFVVISSIAICMADIYPYQADLQVAWPAFVPVIDLILVMRLDHRFAAGVVCCVMLWLLILTAERMTRFGLYDVPLTYSYEVRRERFSDSVINCDKPPCPSSFITAWTHQAVAVVIFLVDFIATRGFARQVLSEQAAMQSTIATVEELASLLAAYDVDAVSRILGDNSHVLPEAMRAALLHLEQNLRAYRPYLPVVLLEQQQHPPDGAGQPCVPPAAAPGAKSERVTLVFTDIRASTSIWEVAPEAMKKAMVVHNTVMRSALSAWGGYEVKTIGDAFMVAFEDAHAAVCFGLDVQENLLAAEWPAALLDVGICSPTELWGGLTVRVGVNEGPVTMETNTLTGRVDYFGHTVNVAARLEAACVPGAVAVPADLWASVRGVSRCVGAYAGNAVPTDLKGVSEPVTVCSVWPASLQGREGRPLHAPAPCLAMSLLTSSVSQMSGTVRSMSQRSDAVVMMRSTSRHDGTVAASTLICTSLVEIGNGLACIVPLLEQSGGVLLSVVGNNFFIGWNVGKVRAAHAESALRFAQRVLQHGEGKTVATLGIASGPVEHGAVGTALQRFVTASGGAVEASLALRRVALSMHVRCLYTAEAPPGAVREMLRPTTARVPQHDGPDAVVYEVEVLPPDTKDTVFSTDL